MLYVLKSKFTPELSLLVGSLAGAQSVETMGNKFQCFKIKNIKIFGIYALSDLLVGIMKTKEKQYHPLLKSKKRIWIFKIWTYGQLWLD